MKSIIKFITIFAIIACLFILFLLILGVWFSLHSCDKFGERWEIRKSLYGPDVCVNEAGEVKYL